MVHVHYYSQPRSRVNSIYKNEMTIRIFLCSVRRVNGMLDISLEILPKKTHELKKKIQNTWETIVILEIFNFTT